MTIRRLRWTALTAFFLLLLGTLSGHVPRAQAVDPLPGLAALAIMGENQVGLLFNLPVYTTGELVDTADLVLTVEGTDPRVVAPVPAIARGDATTFIPLAFDGAPLAPGQTVAVQITAAGAAKVLDLYDQPLPTPVLKSARHLARAPAGAEIDALSPALPVQVAGFSDPTNMVVEMMNLQGMPVVGAVMGETVEVGTDPVSGTPAVSFTVDLFALSPGTHVLVFSSDGGTDRVLFTITDHPPSLTEAVIAADGTFLQLTFDQRLDPAAVPPAEAFVVTVNGTARDVTGVQMEATAVTLTLAEPVTDPLVVMTVDYTVPASGAIQDPKGNAAAGISAAPVAHAALLEGIGAFADADTDHVYFDGDNLAFVVPVRDPAGNPLPDSTPVQVVLGVFTDSTTFVSAPVLTAAQPAGDLFYVETEVTGGRTTLAGTVADPGTGPTGVLGFQLYTGAGDGDTPLADATPLTDPLPVVDCVSDRPALVGVRIPAGEVTTTPTLAAFDNLYATEQPITFAQAGLGRITFAPGLNIIADRDELLALQSAVQFAHDPVAARLSAGVNTAALSFLAGHGATVELFSVQERLGLTAAPAAELLDHLQLAVLDNEGTPVAEPGNSIDLAAVTYDAAADTLRIPVLHFSTVTVQAVDIIPPQADAVTLTLLRGETTLPAGTILRAGDVLRLVVTASEGGLTATWSAGSLVADGALTEVPGLGGSTYTGRYTIQSGDDAAEVAIFYTLTDAAGNSTGPQAVGTVQVDTVVETFAATHDGAQVAAAAGRTRLRAGDTVTITLTAESGGTATYHFATAGGERSGELTETAESRYTGTYTVQATDDYQGSIAVAFTDQAGNAVAALNTGPLFIDTTPPAVTAQTVSQNGTPVELGDLFLAAGDTLEVVLTGEPELAAAHLLLGDRTLSLVEEPAGSYHATFTAATGQDMSGNLRALLVDAAGNTNEAEALGYTVTIDTLPPVVWVEVIGAPDPLTGYYTRFNALYLYAMAEDGLQVVLEEQAPDGSWTDLSSGLAQSSTNLGDGQTRLTYEHYPADGDRTFRYWAEDAAGNRSHAPGEEPVLFYRIDTTLPDYARNLAVAEAVNGHVDSATATVTGDLPSADVVRAEVVRNHQVIAQGSVELGATTFAVAGVPLQEGENTLSVEVYDTAGNHCGSDYLTVIRDTGPPTFAISLVQGTPNQVTVVVSEPLAAPPDITVKLNGDTQSLTTLTQTGPTTYQTTFDAAIGNRTALVVVVGQDAAGHTGTGEYIDVNMDPTYPWNVYLQTLEMQIPVGALQFAEATIAPFPVGEVAGLLDDDQGEAVERPIRFGMSLNEGQSVTARFRIRPGLDPAQVRSVRYFPAAGDPAQVEDITDFTYDPTSGWVTVTLDHLSDYGVIVDETAPDFAFDVLSSPVGNRLLTVTGRHDGSVETINLTGDIVGGPVAAAVDPTGAWSAQVELTSGDGIRTLTATAADAAGNVATRQTAVALDTTPPVLDLTVAHPGYVPGEILYTSASSLGLAGTITDASPVVTYVVQDEENRFATATNSFNLTLPLPANQTSTIRVMTWDGISPMVTRDLQVRRDTLAPALSVALDTTLTSGYAVQYSGSVADGLGGGVETLTELTLTVRRDGTLTTTQDLGQAANFSGSVPLNEDGTYTLNFQATDQVGNTGSLQRTVIKDSNVPPVTLALSDEQLKIGEDDPITATVTTDVGNEVVVKLDGVEVARGNATPAGGSGRFSTTVNVTTDGSHTIRAEVTGSNFLTAAAEQTLLRDTEPPELSAAAAEASTTSSNGSIAASATEPVTFAVSRGQEVVASSSAGLMDATLFVPLNMGQNDFTVTATDPVGNSSSVAVAITRTSPPTSGGSDTGGEVSTPGAAPFITATADNRVTNQDSVRITGKTLAGATVTVQRGGQTLATLKAGGSGRFAYTAALEEGENAFTLTAETAAGSASTRVTITRDTRVPTLEATVERPDVAAETAALVVSTESGAAITVNGSPAATADARGQARIAVTLQVGVNTLHLTATDPAGNSASTTLTVERAFAAPAQGELNGEDGGTVATPDGAIRMHLPGGAAAGDLTLRMVPERPRHLADGLRMVAGAEVTLDRRGTGTPVTRFAQVATLTFRFDPGATNGSAGLNIYYWNDQASTWVMLPTVVDTARGTATAAVDHPARFALLADARHLAPVLDELPVATESRELQITGRTAPRIRVWVSQNDAFVGSTIAGADGRFALNLTLSEGENRIFTLAEAEGLRRAGLESLVTYTAATPAVGEQEHPGAGVFQPGAPVTGGDTSPETTLAPAVPAVPAAPPAAVHLTDLTGHWAEADISALVNAGVIAGFADQSFRPELPVTRAQFAILLARALGLPTAGGPERLTFADADAVPDWAAGAVAAMQEAGLIAGYDDNTFRPDASITRAEMAVLMTRALDHKGVAVPTQHGPGFTDQTRIPDWAREAVDTAAAAGLVGGFPDGSFGPDQTVTRAQAAVMIRRLMAAR